MKTNSEIQLAGYEALVEALGKVYAEKFIALIQQDTFDYTLWQRDLLKNSEVEEVSKNAMTCTNKRKNIQEESL
jgi:hypothetical protein